MNKSQLIAITAEKTGLTKKDVDRVVGALLDTVTATLAAGEKVQLSGFGTFEVRSRKARTGRNLRTRESVQIPAARVPAFTPSQLLREIVEE